MTPEETACEIARGYGIQVDAPIVLQDTNNIVLWLAPSPVVAKIGTGALRRLDEELTFGINLEAASAPVVGPTSLLPRIVHRRDGCHVTFWPYIQRTAGDFPSRSIATALGALHDALDGLDAEEVVVVPSFSEEPRLVARRLDEPGFAPELAARDRELLLRALEDIDLENHFREVLLHGSPHRFNILNVEGSPRFIDFETVCRGPVEWDLAHLEPAVANAYPGQVDERLLGRCVRLVSAKTSAWCWEQAGHNEQMRMHAEHHLAVVREGLG